MSKTITTHRGVQSCERLSGSMGHAPEAKYLVTLKEGWHFEALNEGDPYDLAREALVDSVAEFREAEPVAVSAPFREARPEKFEVLMADRAHMALRRMLTDDFQGAADEFASMAMDLQVEANQREDV